MMPPVELRRMAGEWARSHTDAPLVEAFIAGATLYKPQQSAEISDVCFEDFWNLYDYKKAKPQALRMWRKLTSEQRREIILITPHYVASTPDKQYRMHPATFLNPSNQRWKDEITQRNEPRPQQPTKADRLAGYARTIADYNG